MGDTVVVIDGVNFTVDEEVSCLIHSISVERDNLKEGMVCSDCLDTGWLYNRVEGRYPCTCMTEAEPYQMLEERIKRGASVLRSFGHPFEAEALLKEDYSVRG